MMSNTLWDVFFYFLKFCNSTNYGCHKYKWGGVMEIVVRLFVGDSQVEFEEMEKDIQDKYRQKITDIYAEQVLRRVKEMIKQGKSEKEIMEYLLLDYNQKKVQKSEYNIDKKETSPIDDELCMTYMEVV